jgi:hypothetical protein
MFRPRFASRSPLAVESLERRDCPAAVAVLGGGTIAEGGDSTVLTVRLSAPDTKPVQVGYIISGDGTTPAVVAADYRLTIGTQSLAGPSGTIEFKPGETVKQIRVTAIDDPLREGAESLRFKLFRPLGCTIDAASASVDVTARDNDDYTAALVPQGTSRIAEGASAPFVLELSKPATKAETFFVSTQNGTATTSDYRPLRDMPVTIVAGQRRSQPFSVSTLADADTTETDEYFLLTTRARSTDSPAIDPIGVTIVGARPAAVALTVTDASVKEGNTGFATCTFTVRLNAPAVDPITVQYATANGTASSGVDYVATQGSLVFARGQILKTVTVNVLGDTVVEYDETFQLIATTVGGAATSATGTCTILNDDSAFQIALTYDNPNLPLTQKSVFQRAVDKLQSIIVGDLPDVQVGTRRIDDIEIKVFVETMDPSLNLNGYAMATAWRPGAAGLAYQGEIHINAAKIGNPGIYYTIIHEMLHAIGFSSDFFSATRTISGMGTTAPLFTGANAIREYKSVFGLSAASGVPLYEDPSADGSYASHWSTNVFGTEIMSVGWDTASTGVRPFSRITVGVLQDIGYRVNYGAADPYAPPIDVTPSISARNASRGVVSEVDRGRLFLNLAFEFGRQENASTGNASRPRSCSSLNHA